MNKQFQEDVIPMNVNKDREHDPSFNVFNVLENRNGKGEREIAF